MRACGIATLLLAFAAPCLADPYPPLDDARDPALQKALVRSLDRIGLTLPAKLKVLAIALVDLTHPTRPRLATVNGHLMLYAASLPKIAVLLGAFQQIHDGAMRLSSETFQLLLRMIRASDNAATATIQQRVGMAYLADLLRSPRYRLYDPAVNGGLWCGKEYSKSSRWQGDPLHDISHGATAFQTARFYYLLHTGRLVSPRYSRLMKSILDKSRIRHKFVRGLEARPGARILRKSGSWREWHADSALVERKGHCYVAVGLAQGRDAGQWLEWLIVALNDLITARSPFEAETAP